MPDFAELHRQRQQHAHVTQQLLWELYQRWRCKQDVVLRQEH
jgi:hypothetical protein